MKNVEFIKPFRGSTRARRYVTGFAKILFSRLEVIARDSRNGGIKWIDPNTDIEFSSHYVSMLRKGIMPVRHFGSYSAEIQEYENHESNSD